MRDMEDTTLHLRETFYNYPDRKFSLPELARMLDMRVEDVYTELKNLTNRNIVAAGWDTSVVPRRRLYCLKKR
jgi:hypothetical protein